MEWQAEPNNLKFNHCNLQCEIMRNHFGSLNVYVFIPETNIYYGIDEDDLNTLLRPEREITYSNLVGNMWKIGCDFGHIQDYSPNVSNIEMPSFFKEIEIFCDFKPPTSLDYKNIDYAINIAKKLAEKIANKG